MHHLEENHLCPSISLGLVEEVHLLSSMRLVDNIHLHRHSMRRTCPYTFHDSAEVYRSSGQISHRIALDPKRIARFDERYFLGIQSLTYNCSYLRC